MPLPMIETGYKPEFGLGAVYQGFNAANADNSAELEIIKQFLANQREQQMQPLDVKKAQLTNDGMVFDNMVKNLQGAQANIQNTPKQLQLFAQDKEAGYNKNIRQDEVDSLLQPFKLEAAPFMGQRQVNDANSDAVLSVMQNEIINTPAGPKRDLLQKRFTDAVATRGYTPDFWGRNEVENTKGSWDVQKAEIAANATRDAAGASGKAAWAQAIGPATQEVSKLREMLTKLENNELGEEIAQRVRMAGKKPGTKEYNDALVSEKDKLRNNLKSQYTQAAMFLQQVQAASGIGGAPTQPTGNVIKLD